MMEKRLGQGGGPERQGGKATCECPKCGHVVDHTERGTPCNQIKCPECGAKMGGHRSGIRVSVETVKRTTPNKEVLNGFRSQ
jgi:Zn finger protein HypA/HybF involved in hydrogenase expression